MENRSTFEGTVLEFIGYSILSWLLGVFTLGLATPWIVCMFKRWEASKTIIDGKRLVFVGTGGSLFGQFIKWWFFTIITFGIYGFWVYNAMKRWEIERTHFEDELYYETY